MVEVPTTYDLEVWDGIFKAGATAHNCRCSPEAKKAFDAVKPSEIIDMVHLGDVSVVAVKGTAGDWAAYIGPAEKGETKIAASGHKLSRTAAAVIFGDCMLSCGNYRP